MINLHNHSTWSDGRFTPEELAELGAAQGLTHLGITDHFYTEKLEVGERYVDIDQIAAYVADMRRAADQFAGQIQVLAGIEIDWSFRAVDRLDALWGQLSCFDFVLFEYVQDPEWMGASLAHLIALRPRVPVPVGLAHNDLSRNLMPAYGPQQIANMLEANDIFLELSTAYPYFASAGRDNIQLWRALADSQVRFSVGSDTHEDADEVGRVQSAHAFLEKRGLLGRLITAWWDPARRAWADPDCQVARGE